MSVLEVEGPAAAVVPGRAPARAAKRVQVTRSRTSASGTSELRTRGTRGHECKWEVQNANVTDTPAWM